MSFYQKLFNGWNKSVKWDLQIIMLTGKTNLLLILLPVTDHFVAIFCSWFNHHLGSNFATISSEKDRGLLFPKATSNKSVIMKVLFESIVLSAK